MITVGVDPGLSGAVGVLQDGRFVAVEDMPVVVKGAGVVKNEVSPAALLAVLRERVPPVDSVAAVIERVSSRPGEGVASSFSLGDSFGVARAVLSVARVELTYVTPAQWKKHFKLTADKELSRALALRLFPEAAYSLRFKKHDGRAEALLLARWLWETRYA
jgi:crossover junction endodeoxyribonuclease RuvC